MRGRVDAFIERDVGGGSGRIADGFGRGVAHVRSDRYALVIPDTLVIPDALVIAFADPGAFRGAQAVGDHHRARDEHAAPDQFPELELRRDA